MADLTFRQIEKEVQKVKSTGATKIRVTLLRNPDRPMVVAIVEFDPNLSLLKSGAFPAELKRAIGSLEDADHFRVESIQDSLRPSWNDT